MYIIIFGIEYNIYIYIYIYIHTNIYIYYIYIYVDMCVCARKVNSRMGIKRFINHCA